jgi:hypothetical protein
MLLPEARLDTLIDQLKGLPGPDRRAILARLTPRERGTVRARLRGATESAATPASPFSADIAARLSAGAADTAMTGLAFTTLENAAAALHGVKPDQARPGSLVDAVTGWFRP